MALEGSLKDFSLPDIFQLISLQRKSGILTLKGSYDSVLVYFQEGNILAADSQQDRIEDRLGYYLLRAKLISEEQLSKALIVQKETLQRLGNILLSHNFITKEDLQKTLQLVITQKIYRLFRWQDGHYHFDADAPVEFKDDYFTPIPAQGVLMEAVRMIDEWPMVERSVPNIDIIFRKTDKYKESDISITKSHTTDDIFNDQNDFSDIFGDEKKKEGELSGEEQRILRFVDGIRTVKDIMLDAQMTDFDTCSALAGILKLGYIEPLDEFKVDKKAEWIKSSAQAEKPDTNVGKVLSTVLYVAIALSILLMNLNPINLFTILPNTNNITIQKKIQITKNELKRIDSAVYSFFYANGKYPIQLSELIADGYLQKSDLIDPWGNKFKYVNNNNEYILTSEGNSEKNIPAIQIVFKKFN